MLALIDDAHWLDPPSAEALLFAIRRLLADPVAVVLAVREGHASLLDGADLPVQRVGGLDRRVSLELLSRGAGEPFTGEIAERLYEATGGNPLALLEVAAGSGEVHRHCARTARCRCRDGSPRRSCTARHRSPSALAGRWCWLPPATAAS